METTAMRTLDLPFTDSERNLHYRFSRPDDQPILSTIDSSFNTDRIFQVKFDSPCPISAMMGLGVQLESIQLDRPLHKSFPDEEDSDEDDDDAQDNFTIIVEDIHSSSGEASSKVAGFISAKFSSWNSRLIVTDIEIEPAYRRRGIGPTLVQFAESIGVARYLVRHVWLEVSNVNYPAIQSYLKMGFKVAGLDVSMYVGTESEGEFPIFMWKKLDEVSRSGLRQ
ncbi:GNAT family N-acetyltransferase [Aspergillus tanneri]|uniref:N-acetyltransferase domain-containing protein n=1 Tax=Aspergillus tanneri TaxID=1220188 RepID=A0A5M9N5F6_9EURO|nr:uncharacterized protein ATNIH1004_001397 [Aspergillus tanneri]KAA8652493.1 hypothetical protein ATNIH1004_001397 [Aspergillus tanneri]